MLSAAILAELRDAVGADGLIIERNQLQTYECDALAVLRSLPGAVILPRSTAQLQKAVPSAPGITYLSLAAAPAPAYPEERCPMTGAS